MADGEKRACAELRALRAQEISPTSQLLALNNAHATELSFLESDEMQAMIGEACVALCTDDGSAFLLAFDQAADYSSPNFLWFRERFDRFVYVDRICVAPEQRGRGIARCFYEAVFEHARTSGAGRVVCEVNEDPPNPASDAFHAALGFKEVGSASLGDRGKRVRYFERTV